MCQDSPPRNAVSLGKDRGASEKSCFSLPSPSPSTCFHHRAIVALMTSGGLSYEADLLHVYSSLNHVRPPHATSISSPIPHPPKKERERERKKNNTRTEKRKNHQMVLLTPPPYCKILELPVFIPSSRACHPLTLLKSSSTHPRRAFDCLLLLHQQTGK